MTDHLTAAEYRRRDYRMKCHVCRRWMRDRPTEKTPAKRAPVPWADRCVECLEKARP